MILDEIIRRTEKRVTKLPGKFPNPAPFPHPNLADAIHAAKGGNAVIAEIKCSSPSRGLIRRNVDIGMMAGVLAGGGCVALSVLTEPYFFGGSIRDIVRAKEMVRLPVLRKDFIIDERQIAETRALGADSVLLIAAVLKDRLPLFVDYAYEAGIEPLVEVHTEEEVNGALATRAQVIGINNRSLSTFTIDRSTTRSLSRPIRLAGKTIVSESGIRSADDLRELRPFCDAFLIGSSIMAHEEPRKKLEEFVCA